MRVFWEAVIEPLLDAASPDRVVEIGIDRGETTQLLVEWVAAHGAVLDAIDPAPSIDVDEWLARYPEALKIHLAPSLDVLERLEAPGVALIDGDHNFYTVLNELRLLERRATETESALPIVALHDVGWPYGRRDLYYEPERIPAAARRPYARGGIQLGNPELVERGFNDHLFNAEHEEPHGTGVLGAIEEFVGESVRSWRFVTVPGDHGLGVLADSGRIEADGRIRDLIGELTSAPFLRRRCEALEEGRIRARIRAAELTAALESARAASTDVDPEAERQLAEARASSDRLSAELEAARLELEQANEELDTERQGRTRATKQREKLRAELELEREHASTLRRATEELRGELGEAQRDGTRIERRLSAAEERELELEETIAASRRRERAAEAERDDAEAARQRAVSRLASLEDALATAERDAGRRTTELQDRLDSAERQAKLQIEIAQREADERIAALDRQAEQRLADAEREAAERLEVARHQFEAARADALQTLERQLEDARSRTEDAQNQAAAATAARDAAAAELDGVVRTRARLIADLEDARESLQEQIGDYSAQAETARRSAVELREALEARELEREALVARVTTLEHEVGAIRADRDIAEATKVAVEHRLEDLALENEQLRAGNAGAPPLVPGIRSETPAQPPPVEARTPDSEQASLEVTWLPTEVEASARFQEEYAAGARLLPDGRDAIALPAPEDHRGILLGAGEERSQGRPRVDVIVCVHNALEDVRHCIWSLVEKTDYPFHLILVDDGSDAETAAYLDQVASVQPSTTLIRNSQEPHGYTIAANLGLRAATGDYLILLNSDTIVTPGWIDRIIDCGESDERIGIVGPLSNAASHQSIPELRAGGAWATNPVPRFVTTDGIGLLLERASDRRRPRLPFINGFCYTVKRAVIDAIGYLDEEHFASGYCEENDFSHRAAMAGFDLAVVDDGYVYHAKSKSYTVEGRSVIAKRNYQIFLEKHGAEVINAKVRALESDNSLNRLRSITGDALSSPMAFAAALELDRDDPLRVVFVLPGLGDGGSGGSHSIYQEVRGLRQLGIPARIALAERAWSRALKAYDDASDVFETFADVDELAQRTADADVISATHFKSVELVAELRSRRNDFLPAYYIQDYEPFFTSRDAADIDEAVRSYTRIEDCLLFAKTHWLCKIVADRHDRYVAKVEPSIDEQLFIPRDVASDMGRVRVAAMVRPRTPRRQPSATVAVLDALGRELGDRVDLVTFGCEANDLRTLGGSDRLVGGHRGLLTRTQVADMLAGTDVFLDLSMYQAFGRTALEAMACGSTAVVPRLGGVWEFLEDGLNGIAFDALEPTQALEVLVELCGDRSRLAEMKAAARATAAHYSIPRAALSEYLVFKREHARRELRTGSPA